MFTKASHTLLFCLFLLNSIQAQKAPLFRPVSTETVIHTPGIVPGELPKKFDAYALDDAGIRATLESAPWEFTPEASQHKCLITIPTGEGKAETFSVFKVAMLDNELAAAFPEIQTYAGIALLDSRQTVRFSMTPRGFRAMVSQPDLGAVLIKPLVALKDHYMAFKFEDEQKLRVMGPLVALDLNGDNWTSPDAGLFAPKAENRGEELEPVKLKTYRFCVGAPGEFTQDHGGTKALALAAVTEYSNLVSAVYERDMAIRYQLTNATQYVMFTDPDTDPYLGTAVDGFADQNTMIMTQYTNINSHDVGHVYAHYVGGNQGVGRPGVCTPDKDVGCSASQIDPNTGDYRANFLAIVGQEIGHQMTGGHSWNRCDGGGGRFGNTAYEPGSGSTIMSYAGLCGPDDIVSNFDLYFHAGSIEEIQNHSNNVTCGSLQETTNNPPVVTLPYQDNFNIPISTPFQLNGSATDPDGDALTYSWEGIDIGPETPLGQPQGSTAIFRSWPAVAISNRYFPRLNRILSNSSDPAEQLPTYTRDLTFRFTARDNKPNGGGVSWADVAFKAVEVAGPFLVQSPNTSSTIWRVGELTEVKWDVANTNVSPVNCHIVNIRLSKDGGQTYPITLATATENDGSQFVLVPDELTAVARVRVEAADNVFFDLSNANFKIQNPVQPSLTLGLSTDGLTICLPENFSTTINTAGVLGFNTPVNLDILGNFPPGATGTFSSTTLNPGESSVLNLDLHSVAVAGSFNFTIRAISGLDTFLRPVSLVLLRNDFTGFGLQTPLNGATNLGLVQTLHWGKGLDADNYDIQFSDSPAFTTILASSLNTTLDSLKINFLLEKGKAYFWRVRPRNECGIHAWSEPYFFSTFAENCLSFSSNDLPKNISANGTPSVESKINVLQGGTISDLVVSNINGYHEYFKDLEVHLISPQGTDVLLWKDRCSNFNGGFSFGLSDDAPGSFACPPPNTGAFYRPQNPFSAIIGQNSAGIWTLRVKDNVSGSGGTFSNFSLQFCQSLDVQPPFLVTNIVMPILIGSNRVITPDFLLVEDPNNVHTQLIFTMLTKPERGLVTKDGFGDLKPGDQFTQADIDGGLIRFFDYGISTELDGFRFMVTDGEGGFYGTPKFLVQPTATVGVQSLDVQSIDFSIFPNPASSSVWVNFDRALESNATLSLFNMTGQMVHNASLALGKERMQLELGHLPKGIYVVRVESQSGTGVRKLVIE